MRDRDDSGGEDKEGEVSRMHDVPSVQEASEGRDDDFALPSHLLVF